jgi:prolipoprotein diacylglyceryltransferase
MTSEEHRVTLRVEDGILLRRRRRTLRKQDALEDGGTAPMLPVLARWGDLTLYTHDLFSVAAIAVGLAIYYAELRRRGWLDSRIVWISLAALLGAALGARLITSWERPEVYAAFMSLPLTVAIERSGKSIIGAIVGGYLAIVLAKRAFAYRRSTGDAYALAIPIATAVGRVGCFLSELPLGTPTTLPWGVRATPDAASAFAVCPGCGGPMHPTMLYEIAFNIAAAWLIWRFRRRVPVPGDTLKLYLLGAGAFRFLVEFLRTSPKQALDLTASQWVLIPFLAVLVIHFARQVAHRAWRVPLAPPALETASPAAGR